MPTSKITRMLALSVWGWLFQVVLTWLFVSSRDLPSPPPRHGIAMEAGRVVFFPTGTARWRSTSVGCQQGEQRIRSSDFALSLMKRKSKIRWREIRDPAITIFFTSLIWPRVWLSMCYSKYTPLHRSLDYRQHISSPIVCECFALVRHGLQQGGIEDPCTVSWAWNFEDYDDAIEFVPPCSPSTFNPQLEIVTLIHSLAQVKLLTSPSRRHTSTHILVTSSKSTPYTHT